MARSNIVQQQPCVMKNDDNFHLRRLGSDPVLDLVVISGPYGCIVDKGLVIGWGVVEGELSQPTSVSTLAQASDPALLRSVGLI